MVPEEKKRFELLELAGKAVALLSLVFSIVFFVSDSIAKLRLEKRQNAQHYIAAFNESPVVIYETDLEISFAPYRAYFDLSLGGSADQSVIDKLFDNIILGGDKNGDNRPQTKRLMMIVNYYDIVYSCYSAAICDKRTILDFYCDKVISFSTDYGRFLDALRERFKKPDYGSELRDFASACRDHLGR
jgi:hypothetical protein